VILLTGSSGYVGGRLLHALEAEGASVRCMARCPDFVRHRAGPATEVVYGDVLDPASLQDALRGVRTAYYLVHSMGSTGDFQRQDREGARNFAAAACRAGVERIVYLGGLGRDTRLSPHLRSRQEVGRILRESGVPTLEFRSSIVIGAGSLSFEMIRALVQKLPVMVTPRWVRTRAQPIAIDDLVAYLVEAEKVRLTGSAVFEIGGATQVSYGDIMREYARQRGLRRVMIPVPVLSPHLSSLWLGLVSPLYARIGRKLIDSVRHETVVDDAAARSTFAVEPVGHREAIASALRDEDRHFATTRWSDALSSRGASPSFGGVPFGTRLVDSRVATTTASPAVAFAPIRRIGGDTGWYVANGLWRIRGFIDLLVGGVGTRRGRPHPDRLQLGDTVDFWRVEAFEDHRLLRLGAEMKLPGRAWLQFEVTPRPGGSAIRQTAIFDPVGLLGLAYWYVLYPLHYVIFRRMLQRITRLAEAHADATRLSQDSNRQPAEAVE
jgi:uncharacterized protein YbjT (DUF2867 family)